MRAASCVWCTHVDREKIRSQERFSRLLAAGVYGFSVASEGDARYVLALLDAQRPYADYLVACKARVHSRILHPNFAIALPGTNQGMHEFRCAIASGANAVLSAPSLFRATRAYVRGLSERHRRGFPLFMVRAVFLMDFLSDADLAAFKRYFATSEQFGKMRLRGARVPLLVCGNGNSSSAMVSMPCDKILSQPQPLVA